MRRLDLLKETPSQTAGPYVHIGCLPNFCGIAGVFPSDFGDRMVNDQTSGERITISGVVYDGVGAPLKDAMVEIWQADANGIYPGADPRGPADPNFTGWGRRAGDYQTGEWTFETVKPGSTPFPAGGMQAPHIVFWVAARGINIGLQTRMYFPDEDNAADPILNRIEHQSRVETLVAVKEDDCRYRFDIQLQGDGETIFFDV